MKWQEITKKIIIEFKSEERSLASVKTRLNGLASLEAIMPNEYKLDTNLLFQKGKTIVKNELSSIKTLNAAENTSLNAIYHVLNGRPIPIKKRKQ